ncbi:MAG: hypothetical protein U1F65_08070 [Verrucomicrobiota bacterium]
MNRMQLISSVRLSLAVSLAALVAGCDRQAVQVYQVPKESSAPAPAALPPMMAEAGAQPRLVWTLPAGWQEVPAAQMRLASFAVNGADGKKADVSIIPLGGAAGGELSNVNRWRGQVGLAPVTEEELSKLGESLQVAGTEAKLYDLTGGQSHILVTSLQRDGTSYFFKMTGDDELVGKQKGSFIAFLKSVKFETGEGLPPNHPPVAADASTLPADHPVITMNSPQIAPEEGTKPTWTLPSGWAEEPATRMLIAKFAAGETTARAEVTVSSFPGDVGGLAANVNRWRQQISLPPLGETEAVQAAKPLELPAGKASVVEMDSASGRLVGVILPQGGQTWFFKMMGNEKTVAREKEAFLKFVESVKLPHGH